MWMKLGGSQELVVAARSSWWQPGTRGSSQELVVAARSSWWQPEARGDSQELETNQGIEIPVQIILISPIPIHE